MARTNVKTTDATITEKLRSSDPGHPETDGPVAVERSQRGNGVWGADDAELLDSEPDEYRAVCSCGEEFPNWGAAVDHALGEH